MMKSRSRKKDNFWRIYFVLCAVLVILIVSVTIFFYDYIKVFEYSRPEHAVDEYISSLTKDDLRDLIDPAVKEKASGFEASGVSAQISEILFAEKLSYSEVIGEGDEPTFDVYGEERLLRLVLSENDTGKYGFKTYSVNDVTVFEEWLDGYRNAVTAVVPEKAELYVNGVIVPESYRVGEAFDDENVSEFEQSEEFDLSLVTYEIEGVIGENISVTAKNGGEDVILTNPAPGIYSSSNSKADRVYTVTLPLDAKFTVNGKRVKEKYLTKVTSAYDVNEFEKDTAPYSCVYTFEGLRYVPTVVVTLNDTVLDPVTADENGSVYIYPEDYKKSYTVKVPSGEQLYCNKIAVDGKYKTDDVGKFEIPESVSKYAKADEKYETYVIDGFYKDPEFSLNGDNASLTDLDVCVFYPLPSEKEIELIKDKAQDFTELFIKYSYEGTDYTKANFDAVMAHVKEGSQAYDIIEVSYDSMRYNSNFRVDKLEDDIYDFIKYADGCYGVKVDFSSHGMYAKFEKVSAGTYKMIWIVEDGEWKLAEFIFS